ncbi:MAG: hypothetical protein NVS3B18_11090 [Candidatus Dormibacteria bacterium]
MFDVFTGRLAAALVLAVAFVGVGGASATAARPLTTAFTDDVYFEAQPLQAQWIQRTLATGAQTVLLDVYWNGTAPATLTPDFDATNPADPRYNWSSTDNAVRAVAASGLSVALMMTAAPSWAEGPGRPADATPGTWRPDAAAYGRFAQAAARRYSGSFPDPLRPGAMLPAVHSWQAWAEPNLSVHLAPQWTQQGGAQVPTSPGIYRAMLNAFYAGVTGVNAANTVITSGTGPFGDRPGGSRMSPGLFVRELLCLRGVKLVREPCANPAHFDVLAHHPYEVSAPTTRALSADDVSAPDLGKLTRPLNRAVRLGLALPPAHKRLWVTEFSYDSNPPNPQAVSEAVQARWLQEAFYVFWRQGVDTVVWYLIRDQAPIPDYATAFESGVYLRDGTPKLSLQAFRFPFVIEPDRRQLAAWGRAPSAGEVQIQRLRGTRWATLATLRVSAGQVFERRLKARGVGRYRAVLGAVTSLVWKQP